MLFKIVSRIVWNVMQAGNWLPDFKTSRFKLDQRFNWHCSLIVCTAGSISRSRVRPSARPSVSSLTEAAACGGFAAERRATAARRSAANASSVTLIADAGSWIDLFFFVFWRSTTMTRTWKRKTKTTILHTRVTRARAILRHQQQKHSTS